MRNYRISDFKVDATNMILIYEPQPRVTLDQEICLYSDTAEVLLNHMNWRTNVDLINELGVNDIYDLYLIYNWYAEELKKLYEKIKKEKWND